MMMDPGFGYSSFGTVMSVVVPVLVAAGFVAVIGIWIAAAVRGAVRWHGNNRSPRLTVAAEVVGRRTDVNTFRRRNDAGSWIRHTAASTTYYVTFQVDSGDRMEFVLDGEEYGLLAEGDRGQLTFQGTRYLGFERKK